MNHAEILHWAKEHGGEAIHDIQRAFQRSVELFSESAGEGAFLLDYFEAAVNSLELFGRVKLVHVAKPLEGLSIERRRQFASQRRRALEAVFRESPGFDLSGLKRLYRSLEENGIDTFYPVASVECGLPDGRFDEISLYCDENASELAPAMAGAVGAAPGVLSSELGRPADPSSKRPSARGELFAVGFDFRPGRPSRFKMYHRLPARPHGNPISQGTGQMEKGSAQPHLAEFDSGRAFLALGGRLLPRDFLHLSRVPEGGGLERTRKVYFSYLARRSAAEACTVRAMLESCAPGPLREFLARIEPAAAGQYVDYIGCEDLGGKAGKAVLDGTRLKFEIYFGKPAFGCVGLAALAGHGDRRADI